ncbi:MAG: hypothetical protein AAGC55_22745, partial [Myxococcota bacterium]
GSALLRPTTHEDVAMRLKPAGLGYLAGNALGILLLALALHDLVEFLDLSSVLLFELFLSLFINIMLLTLIGSDLILLGLDRSRTVSNFPGTAALVHKHEYEFERFMGRAQNQAQRPPHDDKTPGTAG